MYFPEWVDNLLTRKILRETYMTIFSDAAFKSLYTEILQRDVYNIVLINSLFNFF